VYLLKTKHNVFDCFKDFHSFILNQYSAHIKILRSDNGTEYMSKDMSKYLHSNGIVHQTSCVGTPQQNGVSERKNRDLLEKTRAIMLQMNVPKHFWSYGILTAVYLVNRLPVECWNLNLLLKFCRIRFRIYHTSRCLAALVSCIYQLLTRIN